MSLRGRRPDSRSLGEDLLAAARGAALAGALVATLAAGALPRPAHAAVHPVIPRPGCAQAPPRSPAQAQRLAAPCRGPLAGARDAPRHLPGRQQQRMRRCNAQARLHQLRGERRQEFMRHCLHRGG